jgi:hypothetical protein
LHLALHVSLPVQSTIDFYENRKQRRAARLSGSAWVNPYDLGPVANWQVRRNFARGLRLLVRWRFAGRGLQLDRVFARRQIASLRIVELQVHIDGRQKLNMTSDMSGRMAHG